MVAKASLSSIAYLLQATSSMEYTINPVSMWRFLLVVVLNMFANYGFIKAQVNLQTGGAQVNIPLYDYKDAANRLGMSVHLSYVSGNGIKVSEVASMVGTGWQLNCGGVITRMQNGAPDDQKQNKAYVYPYTTNNEWFDYAANYYPNGYLYSEYNPSTPVTNLGAYSPYVEYLPYQGGPIDPFRPYQPAPEYLADREQDVFTFSFNGVSGQFVIGKNKVVRSLTDSKLKFEFIESNTNNTNLRTTISQFAITDEAGIQYVFADRELANVCVYDNIELYNKNNGYYYGSTKDPRDGFINVSTGRPLNQYVVNKWFLSEIRNTLTNEHIVFNYETYEVDYRADKIGTLSVINDKRSISFLWQRNKATCKKLVSVNFPSKERLEFKYYNKIRNDVSSEVFLEKMVVKYDLQEVYNWKFNFDYQTYRYLTAYDGITKGIDDIFSAKEKQFARLYLTDIQKMVGSNAADLPFKFEYYPISVPLFSIFQDHYGFTGYRTCGIEPDPGNFYDYVCLSSHLLQTSPSRHPNTDLAKYGLIKLVRYPSGGSLSYEYEPNYCSYNSQDIQVGGMRVKSASSFDGRNITNKLDYVYKLENGQSSGWGYEPKQYVKTSYVRAYKTGGGSKSPVAISPQLALQIGPGNIIGMTSVYGTTRRMSFNSALGNATIALAVSILISVLFDIIADDYKEFTVTEYSSVSTTSNNPLPIQYSRVEIINKDVNDQESGKTVYKFTSPSVYGFEVPTLPDPFSQRQRFAYWAYGLPDTVEVYKKAELSPIKRTVYNYDMYVTSLNDANYISRKWDVKRRLYSYFMYSLGSPTNDLTQETYYPLTGRAELKQTREYSYLSGSSIPSTSSTTDFLYSSNNFQPKQTKTANSKNEFIETNIYYPSDYVNIPMLQTMTQKGMISMPVATQTYLYKNNNKYLISGNVNEYASLPNGDIGVMRKDEFRNSTPVLESQVAFNNSQLIPNANLYKEISYIQYAGTSLPSQVTTNGGNKTAFIYDYGNNAIVAKVAGADQSDIAYSSFEEGNGNWLVTSTNRIPSAAVTGSKCYDIAKGAIVKGGLNSAKTYICSFWKTSNANIALSGVQTSRQSSSYNGWELWVYTVAGVNSITLSGTGLIDELRLYPAGTQMSTKTYRPLTGIASECDQNNKIIYYMYDEAGKLMFVRDQDHNILKRYCYKNTEQSENCIIYGNSLRSQTFTPEIFCSAGLVPEPVQYTVPANTYYSYTQEGADAQAQAEVNSYGQAYANQAGICVQGYFSEDKSSYYYSQNCGSEPTVPYYISVPAGSYISTISQIDANNKAVQYAQALANQKNYCGSYVSLTYTNSTNASGYVVKLTNQVTSQVFYFDIGTGNGPLSEPVPEGTYTVQIYNPYGWGGYSIFEVCNNMESGYSASFYDISITSNGCANFYISQ